MKRLGLYFVFIVLVWLLIACSSGANPIDIPICCDPSPGTGATQGGLQDIGLARALVQNNIVPPKEAFTVEGMFSEYDLPLGGATCQELLCLSGALGIAPTLSKQSSAWVQVGLSSDLDIENFKRPSLSLILVIDVSGSMSWEYKTAYGEYQTPLNVVQLLINQLIPQLNAQDEVAIVTYGSQANTKLSFTSGNQHENIKAVLDNLTAEGSTAMEFGLSLAHEVMGGASGNTDEKRFLLFTDAQPNVGATTTTEFERLVENIASDGIGLTVFGTGIGLDPSVFKAMSEARGGNAFSIFGSEEINRIIQEDWPFLVSPIAYDLSLNLTPSKGFSVAEGYGFPTVEGKAELKVNTVFISRRRGALLVRLNNKELDSPGFFGLSVQGTLNYKMSNGQSKSQAATLTLNQQLPILSKTVALAILVSTMHQAADLYKSKQGESVKLMGNALQRIREDARSHPELAKEVTFAQKLYDLMLSGAQQGTLYGQ